MMAKTSRVSVNNGKIGRWLMRDLKDLVLGMEGKASVSNEFLRACNELVRSVVA